MLSVFHYCEGIKMSDAFLRGGYLYQCMLSKQKQILFGKIMKKLKQEGHLTLGP